MLDISIPKIVVNATSHSLSVVSLTCKAITCVTAHVSLHRGDGYHTAVTSSSYEKNGTKNTRFAWAGGTFFQLCYVVSVFGSGGKKVLVYIRMYYLEYNTVVVLC